MSYHVNIYIPDGERQTTYKSACGAITIIRNRYSFINFTESIKLKQIGTITPLPPFPD